MIVIAFGLVMLVIGTASMVPISLYTQRRLTDRDAVLVASALLTIGLGAINTAALFIFAVRGDIEYFVLPIGLAPVLAGFVSAAVVRYGITGSIRVGLLIVSILLLIVGVAGHVTIPLGLFVTAINVILLIGGMVSPRAIVRSLAPRL